MHLTTSPKTSRLAIVVGIAAATVGVIYGYDSSNIGGAMLYIAAEFSLTVEQQRLVTTTVVVGEIVGALAGGTIANRFGRKPTMVAVAVTFTLFSLLCGLAPSLVVLIIARFLLGLTIGVSVVVVPVFVAESAPTHARGAFLVMYQVATVSGIILGTSPPWRWRRARAGDGCSRSRRFPESSSRCCC